MNQYWNVLTYCSATGSCMNDARYCYTNNDHIYFICRECRRNKE